MMKKSKMSKKKVYPIIRLETKEMESRDGGNRIYKVVYVFGIMVFAKDKYNF
jgi:hypothetical protein